MKKLAGFLVVCLLVFISSQSLAMAQTAVTLTLYVHEGSPSGPVLSGARVTGRDAAGKSFDKTTNTAGYVVITGAPGTWSFTALKTCYATVSWSQSITTTSTKHAYLQKQSPSPPTPISPGSSSEPGPVINTLTPTLQWSSASCADYYALAISKYPYGSSNIVYNPQQLYGTSHTVPSGYLQPGQKYRWNMQARNSAGWSSVSTILYFQTKVTLTLYVHEGSASGPILVGARVTGQDAAGNSFDQTTNTSGYVVISGVPGTWQFSASKPGYQTNTWSQSITETSTKHAFLIKCSYSISPTSQSFGPEGGTGVVIVITGSGCPWTATSNDSWITITSSSSGSGNGIVNYSVASNPSTSSRTGTMTIASQTFTVTQAGTMITTRTLTVASSNPNSGVFITVNPNDNNGQGNGTTQFTRTYNNNTMVTLTAPSTAGGNNFQKWQRNGVDWATMTTTTVTMDANYTMTAVYTVNVSTPTFSITGQVTSGGSGLSGVTMTLSRAASRTTTTDSNGNYSFTGLSNGNYTVTPSKSGCTFSPASRSLSISGSNVTGQNFTANCGKPPTTGTIQINVKLDGKDWTGPGPHGYRLYRNGVLVKKGNNIPETLLNMSPGHYKLEFCWSKKQKNCLGEGSPNEATLTKITTTSEDQPSDTQTLKAGETITFTLWFTKFAQCWRGDPLSNEELAKLVEKFPDGIVSSTRESIRVTAYAVARAESNGNSTACGDKNQSIGLWQIHTPAHFKEYDATRLFEPDYNAEAAEEISDNGKKWSFWCTWEPSACDDKGTGKYRKYLKEAREALGMPLTIISVKSLPSIVSSTRGGIVTLTYNVTNLGNEIKLLLGATFRSGRTDINDPNNDCLVTIPKGQSSIKRNFRVPSTAPGTYDLIVSLMLDLNSNNKIDGSDQTWDLKTFNKVLNVVNVTVRSSILTNTSLTAYKDIKFAINSEAIANVQVDIFDLSGRRVFDSGEVRGNTFTWNLQNNAGKPLANGVYLYVVRVRGFNGKEEYVSEVRKLVILR